jgi:hypothetical protein
MADSVAAKSTLDRLASFRVVYVGLFAYLVLTVATLQLAESLLDRHYRAAVVRSTQVSPALGRVVPQIQERVEQLVKGSPWTRIGGTRLRVLVLGADGRTPIYLEGRTLPPPPGVDLDSPFTEANRLLPAIAEVAVSVPRDSVLAAAVFVGYGAILVPLLFGAHRRAVRRDEALIAAAVSARDATADRARSIQTELEKVRSRLEQIEPAERAHTDEIRELQRERGVLTGKLAELGKREAALRERVTRTSALEQERQALEDLLDEAVSDLSQKESEIAELQDRLKRASKAAASGSRRAIEQLERRVRALYRNLEIDDRALHDVIGLGDETMKLRAEEGLKRLDSDPDSAGVRRKVGGLPPQLSIFELGFAGKGRIYYTRGRQRPYRILCIGAKNSQKTDLEYLSRLSPE